MGVTPRLRAVWSNILSPLWYQIWLAQGRLGPISGHFWLFWDSVSGRKKWRKMRHPETFWALDNLEAQFTTRRVLTTMNFWRIFFLLLYALLEFSIVQKFPENYSNCSPVKIIICIFSLKGSRTKDANRLVYGILMHVINIVDIMHATGMHNPKVH